MKLMIVNFSGNVGKSTITRYLFEPRLEDCKVYSVESINENEHLEENLRGNALGIILDDMIYHDNCLVDVGSSNAESVIALLSKYDDSHEDFDAFILPTINKKKVISDTIATARALNSIGVPAEKIIIILNQIDVDTSIEIDFSAIKAFNDVILSFDESLAIPTHDFFSRVAGTGKDLTSILNDDTDYAKLIRSTPKDDETALSEAVLMRALQRLAKSLDKDLGQLFVKVESKIEG